MSFSLSSTVSIGRLELDSARRVLEKCSTLRQKKALPYLLALYTFIQWWENYACWSLGRDWETEGTEEEDFPWEMELSTTWCERPEIVELIDIADLNLQGVQLALYPADVQSQLLIHCPTLVGVIRADLCVGVRLDLAGQQATILGFMTIEELMAQWQLHPPNAAGFFTLPSAQLHPASFLAETISQFQLLAPTSPVDRPITATVPTPWESMSWERKNNRNFTPSPGLTPEKMAQVLEKLSVVGVSPFAVGDWDEQTAIHILQNQDICQKVLAVHRVLKAFQSHSEKSREFPLK